MFTGAQIATTKLIHRNKQNELIDIENEDKTARNLVNMSISIPHSKAAIVVENEDERIKRKTHAEEQKYQRIIEQQKIVQQMENLMEKAINGTTLTKEDETKLRNKIETIMKKVNKQLDETGIKSVRRSNDAAFHLWNDKDFHS